MGSCPTSHGIGQQMGLGDDHVTSAVLQKIQGGLHLGFHAARGKVALPQIMPGLRRGDAIKIPLVRLAIVERHLVHPGGYHQQLGVQMRSQQGGRGILVDHRRTTLE